MLTRASYPASSSSSRMVLRLVRLRLQVQTVQLRALKTGMRRKSSDGRQYLLTTNSRMKWSTLRWDITLSQVFMEALSFSGLKMKSSWIWFGTKAVAGQIYRKFLREHRLWASDVILTLIHSWSDDSVSYSVSRLSPNLLVRLDSLSCKYTHHT